MESEGKNKAIGICLLKNFWLCIFYVEQIEHFLYYNFWSDPLDSENDTSLDP
jgi:hypothetical protein